MDGAARCAARFMPNNVSVVLINPKYPANLGGVLRACACWNAKNLYYTGKRVISDTERLPRELRMHEYKSIHVCQTEKPIEATRLSTPVAVEFDDRFNDIVDFEHPENAAYVFGPEDGSIPKVYKSLCHSFIRIPTKFCLNLTAAVNVVLYDRHIKERHAATAHAQGSAGIR